MTRLSPWGFATVALAIAWIAIGFLTLTMAWAFVIWLLIGAVVIGVFYAGGWNLTKFLQGERGGNP